MSIRRFIPERVRLRRAAAALGALAILLSGSACASAAATPGLTTPIAAGTAARPASPQTIPPPPTGAAPTATLPPQPSRTQRQATAAALQPAVEEKRMLEVEWPAEMRLGESDTLRLALLPAQAGYTVSAEFEEHPIQNGAVTVARMEGYSLWAAARVDAAGFRLSPEGEQARELPADSPVTWRWTLTPRDAGRQRISVVLLLRWMPLDAAGGSVREREVYSRSLTIRVTSFLGLTAPQAAAAGFLGLGFGGAFSLPLVWFLLRPRPRRMRAAAPNPALLVPS
jgi:hypothetical protein